MNRTILEALEEAATEIDGAESWLRAQIEAKGYEVSRLSIERDHEYSYPEGCVAAWRVRIRIDNAKPFKSFDGLESFFLTKGERSLRQAIETALAAIEAITPRNAYDADFGVAA